MNKRLRRKAVRELYESLKPLGYDRKACIQLLDTVKAYILVIDEAAVEVATMMD